MKLLTLISYIKIWC